MSDEFAQFEAEMLREQQSFEESKDHTKPAARAIRQPSAAANNAPSDTAASKNQMPFIDRENIESDEQDRNRRNTAPPREGKKISLFAQRRNQLKNSPQPPAESHVKNDGFPAVFHVVPVHKDPVQSAPSTLIEKPPSSNFEKLLRDALVAHPTSEGPSQLLFGIDGEIIAQNSDKVVTKLSIEDIVNLCRSRSPNQMSAGLQILSEILRKWKSNKYSVDFSIKIEQLLGSTQAALAVRLALDIDNEGVLSSAISVINSWIIDDQKLPEYPLTVLPKLVLEYPDDSPVFQSTDDESEMQYHQRLLSSSSTICVGFLMTDTVTRLIYLMRSGKAHKQVHEKCLEILLHFALNFGRAHINFAELIDFVAFPQSDTKNLMSLILQLIRTCSLHSRKNVSTLCSKEGVCARLADTRYDTKMLISILEIYTLWSMYGEFGWMMADGTFGGWVEIEHLLWTNMCRDIHQLATITDDQKATVVQFLKLVKVIVLAQTRQIEANESAIRSLGVLVDALESVSVSCKDVCLVSAAIDILVVLSHTTAFSEVVASGLLRMSDLALKLLSNLNQLDADAYCLVASLAYSQPDNYVDGKVSSLVLQLVNESNNVHDGTSAALHAIVKKSPRTTASTYQLAWKIIQLSQPGDEALVRDTILTVLFNRSFLSELGLSDELIIAAQTHIQQINLGLFAPAPAIEHSRALNWMHFQLLSSSTAATELVTFLGTKSKQRVWPWHLSTIIMARKNVDMFPPSVIDAWLKYVEFVEITIGFATLTNATLYKWSMLMELHILFHDRLSDSSLKTIACLSNVYLPYVLINAQELVENDASLFSTFTAYMDFLVSGSLGDRQCLTLALPFLSCKNFPLDFAVAFWRTCWNLLPLFDMDIDIPTSYFSMSDVPKTPTNLRMMGTLNVLMKRALVSNHLKESSTLHRIACISQ